MTKKIIYTIISIVMIIAVMTGCHQGKETVSSVSTEPNTTAVTTTESASESTTAETTTKVAKPSTMNETTEKKTTESSTAKATTNKAYSTTTTTKKHTTTATTKRVTTTQKPSTTRKATTTKKSTTEAPYFCDEGGTHHDVNVGQIGWVDTYDEAVDKALEYIEKHGDSGNFRVKQCYGCGKYTATITID